jgi:5-methyltetrahydrofolate--homocysteine methyltransferase
MSTAPTMKPAATSSRPTPSAAPPLVLAEYGLDRTEGTNSTAPPRVSPAGGRRVLHPARPRFVAGSIGPTTKAITVTGGVTFPNLRQNFYAQAKALVEGGADILLVETCQDTRNVKAALLAIRQLPRKARPIPVMVSGTIEPMGTMLAGQTADAFWASIAHCRPALHGAELRHRPGVHDGPCAHPA